MELMANTNNVLRGGLTPKHVDVPELLANVVFEGGPANILQPVRAADGAEWIYRTAATEFELRRINVSAEQTFQGRPDQGADIVVLTNADPGTEISVHTAAEQMQLRQGDAFLAPFAVGYAISASAPATLFRATVPA
jgi:mannose-6-phosphate isomerase class I